MIELLIRSGGGGVVVVVFVIRRVAIGGGALSAALLTAQPALLSLSCSELPFSGCLLSDVRAQMKMSYMYGMCEEL